MLVLVTQSRDSEAAGLEGYRIPARVPAEPCEVVAGPGAKVPVKEPGEMTCDVVLNPAEPDATDNEHRGVGYLVQVMETYAPEEDTPANPEESSPPKPDLITHLSVDNDAERRRADGRPDRVRDPVFLHQRRAPSYNPCSTMYASTPRGTR